MHTLSLQNVGYVASLGSAELTVYLQRVAAAGGSVYSKTTTRNALATAAGLPGLVQWLDTRFGVKSSSQEIAWYSLTGAAADAYRTPYGFPQLRLDARLNQPVWYGGVFAGGSTPDLALPSSYTWGMRYYQPAGGANGFFWGNRYGSTAAVNSWNYAMANFWRNYYGTTDRTMAPAMPTLVWEWLWIVKNGPTVTAYDSANNVLASVTLATMIGALPVGIAGGTEATGVSSNLTYQSFVRAAAALTPAQRATIQAV